MSSSDSSDSSDTPEQQQRAITRDHVIRMLDRVAAEAAGNNPGMTATKLASLRDPAQTAMLDLSGIGADDLAPGALVGFDTLRRLNLSANALASLDAERLFHGEADEKKKKKEESILPPLTWLKLSKNVLDGNNLRSISRLTQLTTLSLSYNKITKLPREALKTLVNLKALVIDHNEIEDLRLPKSLKALSTLIVSHNKLKELDADRVLSRLPALVKLSAAGNKLTTFPDFSLNPLLIEIRLAHNELTALPEPETKGDFGRQLARLRVLDLSSNKIETWKDLAPLAELPLLSSLSLKHNPVTGVPVPSKSSSSSSDAGTDAKKRRVGDDDKSQSKDSEADSESEEDEEEEDDSKTSAADVEKTKAYVGKLMALVPRVQHVDYKPLVSYGLNIENVQNDFRRKWTQKEERRKRNLVSDKLHKPDSSKPRNKPCACGSGLKYKMCCEKTPKETTVVSEVAGESSSMEVVEPAVVSTKRKRSSDVEPAVVVAVETEKVSEEQRRKAKASKQKLLETLSMNDAQRRSGVVAVVNASDTKESGTPSKRSRGGRRARADVAAAVAVKKAESEADVDNSKKKKKTDVAAALRAKKGPVIGAVASISAPAWD